MAPLMTKRMLIMLAVMIAFIAIIGGFKFFQFRKMASSGGYQAPPEAVTTVVASQEAWDTTLHAIGSVEAVNGVTVSADLPGLVDQISFDSGRSVTKGDVLLRLDTKQERAQLAAAEAQLELTRVEWARAKEMVAKSIISQSTYDTAAATYKQAEARVGETRATIERKTIRAPFSGVLGIRQVNLGQYLPGGAPIVSLQAVRPTYVNFTVPQQEIGRLAVGSVVHVKSDAMKGEEVGKISAFDSVIDEATRNAHVQAVFANVSGNLRPGMFVEADLAQGERKLVTPLPVSAISYAPFGDSVFIVENMTGEDGKTYRGVRQQFVKLGGARGDQVAVMTGVKPGEEIVTSGVFKLRPKAAVVVNNKVQPPNSAAPKPENG
jgi:membrane fusion protein (multidrug efflux system)